MPSRPERPARSTAAALRRLSGRAGAAIAAAMLLLAGCDGGEDEPYIKFVGGGFIFNYNVAEAYYGFVARQVRTIPPGTILEAQFEDPSGGAPFLVRQTAREGQIAYTFRSPGLEGVKAGVDYAVELRLLEASSGQVMARYGKSFQSTADQDILPEVPLTLGPAYTPNPAAFPEFTRPPGESKD